MNVVKCQELLSKAEECLGRLVKAVDSKIKKAVWQILRKVEEAQENAEAGHLPGAVRAAVSGGLERELVAAPPGGAAAREAPTTPEAPPIGREIPAPDRLIEGPSAFQLRSTREVTEVSAAFFCHRIGRDISCFPAEVYTRSDRGICCFPLPLDR